MKQSNLLYLAISHYIHLTSEQRRRLAEGDSVSAVGYSVPVWCANGKTNEPAPEVFCNYIVHNHPGTQDQIFFKPDGYEFNLPQLPPGFVMPEEIPDEEWAILDPEERNAVSEERYVPPHGRNLLDPNEGGSGRLFFTKVNRAKMRGVSTVVYHTVRIADVSELKESLV